MSGIPWLTLRPQEPGDINAKHGRSSRSQTANDFNNLRSPCIL
jgi:hypothetical protein